MPNKYGDGRDRASDDDAVHTGVLSDIGALKKQGILLESFRTLWDLMRSKMKGGPVDDKTMIVGSPQNLPLRQGTKVC